MKHFKFINYPKDCLKSLKTVYFGSGNWALDSTAKAVLRQNAACLSDNPGIDIILEGHCDKEESIGLEPQIGKKRAEAVKDYLVKLGVKKNRFEIEDRGATMPISPGDDKTALAKNRRVEFILKYKIDNCNSDDHCNRENNCDGCEKCDGDTDPGCDNCDIDDTCQTDECIGCEQCDADDICINSEPDCIPDETCDNDDDCGYCDKDEDIPDCNSKDKPEPPLPEPPVCEHEEDACPVECGIMEISPFPECRGDESRTPHNGGKGQSA